MNCLSVFPAYGFERHKAGIRTKQHLRALQELGPCPAHRCTGLPRYKRVLAEQGVSSPMTLQDTEFVH